MEDIEEQIEALKKGLLPTGCQKIDESSFHAVPSVSPDKPNMLSFIMTAPFVMPDGPDGNRALAFEYEVCAIAPPRSQKVSQGEEDDYYKIIRFPCRIYKLEMKVDVNSQFKLSNPAPEVTFQDTNHPLEEKRHPARLNQSNEVINWDVWFPLPGAKYALKWRVW